MSLKLLITAGLLVLGAAFVSASEKEIRTVEKNCWIEIFDDSEYDADDPHVIIQGPAEFATLKNLNGRDWSNDIESVIVGPSATVHAFKEKDFMGTEIAFTPGQRVPKLSKLDMSNTIESMNITCG